MKLNYKRTTLVGLAFFAICSFWQLYDHIIPLMLKYTFGVNDTLAGGVMALDNVLALFMLPLFGALSDGTKTRWGRRMPFIVLGSLGASLAMLLIPVGNAIPSLPLFICGLALTLFFMSTYRSPAVALMPDVTPKPLRSKGNAIINLMGAVGGIIVLGLVNLLLPKEEVGRYYNPNYMPVFLCTMGIMLVSTLVLVLTVREPKLAAQMEADSKRLGLDKEEAEDTEPQQAPGRMAPEVRRSMLFLLASVALWFMGYNAVTTSFSKYCAQQFGMEAGASALVLMIAQAAAIVSFIPVGIIATKVGRKKSILTGIILLGSAFAAGSFFTTFNPGIYVLFVMAGIAWAAINVNSYPMVVEMAKGANVGKFTGYYYTASMAAQIVTPILSGAALQYIGYETLFPYGALFVGLSLVTMLFVRHGNAKPLPAKSKLEMYEAMDD